MSERPSMNEPEFCLPDLAKSLLSKHYKGIASDETIFPAGDKLSTVWVIYSPTDVKGFLDNRPLASVESAAFISRLGISRSSFLWIPIVWKIGVRPSMKLSEITREFLMQGVKRKLVTKIVTIGSDAFRLAIGRGYKPSMISLAGNTITSRDYDNLLVFAFPDWWPLKYDKAAGGATNNKREIAIFLGFVEQLRPIISKFHSFYVKAT